MTEQILDSQAQSGLPLDTPPGNPSVAPPELSVVIPVYNEEAGLQALFDRLYPALDALHTKYEVIFINDRSRERSPLILSDQYRKRPDVTRVVLFNGNYGQHMAIMAGFSQARGQSVITVLVDRKSTRLN